MLVNALARWTLLVLGLVLLACAPTRVRRTITPPSQASTLDQKSPYLRAHLESGYVYVLDSWQVDTSGTLVVGRGTLLTPNRSVERPGGVQVAG